MSFARKIAHNTIAQFSGKVVSTILGLVTLGIMARYLGQIGFGQYTIIVAVLQFAGILADLGLSLVVVQMLSEDPDNEQSIVNNIFTFRGVTGCTLFGLTIILSFFLPYDPIVKTGIIVTTVSSLAGIFTQLFVGVFQSKLAMVKTAIAEVAGRVILLVGILAVIALDLGLLWIMGVISVASLLQMIMNLVFMRKWLHVRPSFDMQVWKRIWKKSWPIGLSIVFNLMYFKADTIILSLVKSEAETGIYGATYKVLEVMITLPFMFLGLMVPFFTRTWKERDTKAFFNLGQKSFDLLMFLAVPIVFGGFVLGNEVMATVAGPDFAVAGGVLQILVFAIAAIFLSNVFTHIIVAIDKQRRMMSWFLLTAVVALIGYLVFIPRYSYWGAAWMTVVAESIVLLTSCWVVYRETRFLPNLKNTLKSIVASIVMVVAIFLMEFLTSHVSLLVIFGALVYCVMLFLLGAVSKELIYDIIRVEKGSDDPSDSVSGGMTGGTNTL